MHICLPVTHTHTPFTLRPVSQSYFADEPGPGAPTNTHSSL